MALKTVNDSSLSAIADAIRAKTGKSDAIAFPNGFVDEIEGIETKDDDESEPLVITDFSYFHDNGARLDLLGKIDTSQGTKFKYMFNACTSITTIPLIDTAKGIDFSRMFANCYELETIQSIVTINGESFEGMFANCKKLTSIPVISLAKGTDFGNMFVGCQSITEVHNLNMNKGTSFYSMFSSCTGIVSVGILDTTSGTNFNKMFAGCTSLESVYGLITDNAENLEELFDRCENLVTVQILATQNAKYFGSMFYGCKKLQNIPTFNTSNGEDFSLMFYGCSELTSVYGIDLGKATNSANMFNGCSNLTTVTFIGDTPASLASTVFKNCTALATINVPWSEGAVSGAPWGAPNNPTINYEYGAEEEVTVTIVARGVTPSGNTTVTLEGQTYSTTGATPTVTTIAELTVPSGTVMSCHTLLTTGTATNSVIDVNGTIILAKQETLGVPATYDYIINGNIIVNLYDAVLVAMPSATQSRIYINEIRNDPVFGDLMVVADLGTITSTDPNERIAVDMYKYPENISDCTHAIINGAAYELIKDSSVSGQTKYTVPNFNEIDTMVANMTGNQVNFNGVQVGTYDVQLCMLS